VLWSFPETSRGVAVKNGPTEGSAFHGVTIAATRAVSPSQNEFKFPCARLTENSDRGTAIEAVSATVRNDLIVDSFCILFTVETHEDILDHGLLVFGEICHHRFRDVPVVINLEAQLVVVAKANFVSLLHAQSIVEGFDEGVGSWLGLVSCTAWDDPAGSDGASGKTGGLDKRTASYDLGRAIGSGVDNHDSEHCQNVSRMSMGFRSGRVVSMKRPHVGYVRGSYVAATSNNHSTNGQFIELTLPSMFGEIRVLLMHCFSA
jgi:hypothetical protein